MANVFKFVSNLFRKTTVTRNPHLCSRYSSVTKDLLRSLPKESTTAIHNQDILLGTLKTAPTTANVLDIVKSHAVVMNNKHLMQALRSLFALQKGGQSNLSTQQILKHPDFELLCKSLKKHAGTIELNETIEALKVVCYVGASSDSTIVQVLLQLLRHQINNLSLQQIIFLDFLLSQMKPTPLIEALQLALPLIFEIQLPIKLDRENIQNIADCLFFASKKNVSSKCIEDLLSAVLDFNGTIESKTMMSLLWSICDLKPNSFFETLVTRLVEDLIVDIDNLNYGDIETTLTKLTLRYSSKYPFYYSDVLCDLAANYIIDHDLGYETALFALKKFHKCYHTNDKLLDYLSQKFVMNEDIFHESDPLHGFNYINSLALSDYEPLHWDRIKLMLANTNMYKNVEKREIIWLRLAANLCTLDIYKLDVLEMAFKESYMKKISKTNHMSDYENLIFAYQAIKINKPELQNMLPNEQYIERAANRIKSYLKYEYPLQSAVLNVFGGEKYVKTGVTTNLHHHIDHLIVLRKGGYPVAFASVDSPNCLEDIELTEDAQLIAIISLGANCYTTNTKRLQRRIELSLQTLEKKGCSVVPVNITLWSQLQDYERIPYLMQLIKSKTNENELVSNINI